MQSLCSWSTSESSQCQTHPWSFNNTNNFSDSLVRKIVKIQVKTLLFHINHKCKKINETQCKILWINLVTTCIMKDEEVLHFLWLTFAFTFVHHWVMTITKMHYANNLTSFLLDVCSGHRLVSGRCKIGRMTDTRGDWQNLRLRGEIDVLPMITMVLSCCHSSSPAIIVQRFQASRTSVAILINCKLFKDNTSLDILFFRIKS